MIKRLQKQFILMTMFFLGIVVGAILILQCVQTYERNKEEIEYCMDWCLELTTQEKKAPTLPSYTLIFDNVTDSYMLLGDRRYQGYDVESIRSEMDFLTYDEMVEKEGVYYEKKATVQGYIGGVVDASVLIKQFKLLVTRSVLIFAGSMAVFFLAVYSMSKWIVAPVQETWDAHKRFIADASHELKTPLTIILADSELLLDKYPNNPWLASLYEEASRMKQLIYSLLELARYDALPTSPKERFDLSSMCEKISLGLEEYAYEKKVLIEESFEPNILIDAEKENTHRLISLLFDNAIKYAPEESSIRVCLVNKEHHFLFTIENRGHLSSEQMKHIFDRFYKTDESRKKDGSYGLGLAIAKEIAQRNRMSLQVDSKNEKVVFSIYGKSFNTVK